MAHSVPHLEYEIKINNIPYGEPGSEKVSYKTGHNSIHVKYTPDQSLTHYMARVTLLDEETGLDRGVLAYQDQGSIQSGVPHEYNITVNSTNFSRGNGVYRICLYAKGAIDGTWDITEILFTLGMIVTSDREKFVPVGSDAVEMLVDD